MKEYILVVDDQDGVADTVADYITAYTSLKVVAVDNPESAVDAVRQRPIKVVILDQRMPEKSGIELSSVLRSINKDLRVIMFTGEASKEELLEAAYERNFNEILQKANLERLPTVVTKQLLEYDANAIHRIRQDAREIYRTRRLYWIFGPRIRFCLVRLDVIDENFVPLEAWSTYVELTRGQAAKRSWAWTTKTSISVETQSQIALKATIGSKFSPKLVEIQSALERAVTESSKEVKTIETSSTESQEVSYFLSDQESNVRSRHLERAPVYRQWLALIRAECGTCAEYREIRLILDERKALFATRQVDYLANGETEIHQTGIVSGTFEADD